MKRVATGIFFVALLLNVKITLDGPYFLVGHELVAQTTGTGTGTGTGTSTGTSTGTVQPDPTKYTVWHFPCFDKYGVPTGKQSAACAHPGFDEYHSHSCE